MLITITGNAASGKSTVGRALAKKLGFRHYSAGDFMRQIADEKGISLNELGRIAENSIDIDDAIDKRTIELAKSEDNFVIDSRLAWHFAPKATKKKVVKIFLYVTEDEQARRLMLDKRKGELFKDKKEAIKKTAQREKSERKRYKKYYSLDYHQKKHYDLWLDTSKLNIESVTDKLMNFLKKQN